jgi:hypothetical protein
MTKKKLNRAKIAGFAYKCAAFVLRIEWVPYADLSRPADSIHWCTRREYCRVERWRSLRRPLENRYTLFPAPISLIHVASDIRVVSVISNCTGRSVFFCTICVRSRIRSPAWTSEVFSATRSHARNLLSIARLNNARSLLQPLSSRRIRIAQTSLGLKGRFWPTKRPLFHG